MPSRLLPRHEQADHNKVQNRARERIKVPETQNSGRTEIAAESARDNPENSVSTIVREVLILLK